MTRQSPAPKPRGRLPARPPNRPATIRPLDDRATEVVRVIAFELPAGKSIQPVLLVERELLH